MTTTHSLSDEALRKLPHADWLAQFALTLQTTRVKRGQPVTPFLLGAVSRLQMAADYIRILEADIKSYAEPVEVGGDVSFDDEPFKPRPK